MSAWLNVERRDDALQVNLQGAWVFANLGPLQQALDAIEPSGKIRLHADSQYVLLGITKWIVDWKRRGWKTADKKPEKNVDLWQRLDELARLHEIEWVWVRGHSGHVGNERADALANRGVASVAG